MVNTYSDIAIRPEMAGFPLVNQGAGQSSDAKDAADFQRILNKRMTSSNSSTAANSAPVPKGSFKSFVKGLFDVVNPLQHIPVVSAIYRHITGDQISPGAHFIGDALYGGPVGGALAAADIAFQKTTGKDVGETMIASLTGHSATPSQATTPDTALASNLNQVSPAAGGTKADGTKIASAKDIIWFDGARSTIRTKNSGYPLFPPSSPTGTIGEDPATPSTPAPPVLQTRGVASTTTLQTQEAPVGTDRKAVPPELIVSKMMEGLQKYAAMNQPQQDLVPNISALY